jgi:prepilin-type N-terminal cleavage/methylation domain-containing protein/prepilin-type processing-associated H-X9-DG protein
MKHTRFTCFPGALGKSRKGFSFIELLVVCAVISVLMAVLIPSFQQVKRKAQTISCANNLRQIGTATMLYVADHKYYPHSSHVRLWADWGEFLIPYLDQLTAENKWVPGNASACGLYKLNDGSGQHLAHEVGQGTRNSTTGVVYSPGYSYFTCPVGPPSKHPSWYKGNAGTHVYSHNYACNEYLMPYGRWSNSLIEYADETAAETAYVNGDYRPFPPVDPGTVQRPGSLILICDSGVDAVNAEASDTLFGPLYLTYQPGSPENEGGVIAGGIVGGFRTDPAAESANANQAVITPPTCDNDLGAGLGWPVYYRHHGRCNALMADGHVENFFNGQMSRRNFVSQGRTKNWDVPGQLIEANYP